MPDLAAARPRGGRRLGGRGRRRRCCLLLLLFALARLRALGRAGAPARRPAARVEPPRRGTDPRRAPARGVVRYDAFGDMGGRLSFSAALLDDSGDGLVLTSINGRSETRTYAKALAGLQSEHTLSPEEQQAIRDAQAAATARAARAPVGFAHAWSAARPLRLPRPGGHLRRGGAAHLPAAAAGRPAAAATRRRGAGGGPPRRGRPRAGADRELGRGLGRRDPRRARRRRSADGHPRGAAAGVVRADGAAGHRPARRTPGGHPPARRGPVPALAGDGAAGRDRRARAVDGGRGGRRWPTAAPSHDAAIAAPIAAERYRLDGAGRATSRTTRTR